MQYEMDSSHTTVKHLRTMSAMVCDLKVAGWEISEEEQVLTAIRALPSELGHWKNVNLVMNHSEHMKTFVEIQSHLEMEK